MSTVSEKEVPTQAVITPTVPTKVKRSKNPVIDRASYVDNTGNRLAVILRKRTPKSGTPVYRVSVAYRVAKETVTGSKSSHATEAEARKTFESIKTKVEALGWKVRVIEQKTKNPDGYFTIDSLPKIDQKAAAIAALKASVAKSAPAKADGKKK